MTHLNTSARYFQAELYATKFERVVSVAMHSALDPNCYFQLENNISADRPGVLNRLHTLHLWGDCVGALAFACTPLLLDRVFFCIVHLFRKRMLDANRLAENAKKYHTGQQERFFGKSMFYAINDLQTNSKRPVYTSSVFYGINVEECVLSASERPKGHIE